MLSLCHLPFGFACCPCLLSSVHGLGSFFCPVLADRVLEEIKWFAFLLMSTGKMLCTCSYFFHLPDCRICLHAAMRQLPMNLRPPCPQSVNVCSLQYPVSPHHISSLVLHMASQHVHAMQSQAVSMLQLHLAQCYSPSAQRAYPTAVQRWIPRARPHRERWPSNRKFFSKPSLLMHHQVLKAFVRAF